MMQAEYERKRRALSPLTTLVLEALEGPCATRCMDDDEDRIETAKAISEHLGEQLAGALGELLSDPPSDESMRSGLSIIADNTRPLG